MDKKKCVQPAVELLFPNMGKTGRGRPDTTLKIFVCVNSRDFNASVSLSQFFPPVHLFLFSFFSHSVWQNGVSTAEKKAISPPFFFSFPSFSVGVCFDPLPSLFCILIAAAERKKSCCCSIISSVLLTGKRNARSFPKTVFISRLFGGGGKKYATTYTFA